MTMSTDTYLAFVAICAVAVVIPGPTNTLILANGIRQINLRDPAGNGVELNFAEYADPNYEMRPSGDPSKLA